MNKIVKKKKLLLGIVVAVLVVVAILGYTLEKKKQPLKVGFITGGGGVVFDHQLHTGLKDTSCRECHHNYDPGDKDPDANNMNCRSCHYGKEFAGACEDAAIHKRCIGKNCQACHVQGTVQCTFCHNEKNFKKAEQPKTVKFETDGGLVEFDHFTHSSDEGYDIDCDTCHHGYKEDGIYNFPMSCRRCHYNKKYESLCENADTHVRCIGKNCLDCHEDGAEDCSICHKE